MPDRYFAPDLTPDSSSYILVGDEAHHVRSVCRGRIGDEIELFNGKGLRAAATIRAVARKQVELEVVRVNSQPPPARTLTIACALPKGDRATVLVEKCTELGVGRLVPLSTARSVASASDSKIERFRKIVVEACKQSSRDYLMEVTPLAGWTTFAANQRGERCLLDPSGSLAIADLTPPPDIVAVGPEGGWTSEELSFAHELGWKIARLPGHILRVETAVIAVAAWQCFRRDH